MGIRARITDKQQSNIAALVPLSQLQLDTDNPRFGGRSGLSNQTAILDYIVASYGVDDVISSLAVNGYFNAEPLVGRSGANGIVIVEGNRRLAACLILSDDPRAANQRQKANVYRNLWIAHKSKRIDPVPVITFDGEASNESLLSYLGVRHISASSPWDSYAKAHWAAQVVNTTQLTVADISVMIGDPHRTVARLLEGYYVVRQVTKAGYFNPQLSVRKGRGSVTEYPFSWVYTILGYTATRSYLALPDGPVADPIPDDTHLERAGFVLTAMFGNSELGRNSVIDDSRALGNLASALLDPEKVRMLRAGEKLEEVLRQTRPVQERIQENLFEVRRLQGEIVAAFASENVGPDYAAKDLSIVQANRRAAAAIEVAFRNAILPDNLDD